MAHIYINLQNNVLSSKIGAKRICLPPKLHSVGFAARAILPVTVDTRAAVASLSLAFAVYGLYMLRTKLDALLVDGDAAVSHQN